MKFLLSNAGARASAVAITTIVFAAPVSAQKPAVASCDIDNSKPQAVARATFSMARASAALKAGNPTKDLRDVVATLNSPSLKNENPVGRAYLLGQAYILLLGQPDIQPISTRSAIGLTTDPNGTIDLFAAADSAWKIVEASSPACVSVGQQWRQQKPWLDVTNAAINALNAGKLDSAEMLANRALTLDRNAPYAYSVLGSVSRNRAVAEAKLGPTHRAAAEKYYTAASQYWKQTLDASGTDSTFNDVRERTLFDVAATITNRLDETPAPSAAQKKVLAREAIAAWNALLANSTDDIQRTAAVQSLSKMYIIAGDSASIGKIYAPMVAEPARYGEATLMQAGVVASQFKHPDDAAIIFAAVLARNPYQRDALNNLAASYIFLGEFDKVFPIVTRLTDVDPSNPENWMLNAYSYAGLLKTHKTGKLNKQYTDSLVLYSGKADKMGVKVWFSEFSKNADGTTLAGTVENKSAVAKTYPFSVDFLDRAGQVLFTETVSIGPVAAKGSKEFRIKSTKGGVAGFRYKPVL